jgi:hypothetical protein
MSISSFVKFQNFQAKFQNFQASERASELLALARSRSLALALAKILHSGLLRRTA